MACRAALLGSIVVVAFGCGGGDGGPDGGYASSCGPVDEMAAEQNTLLASITRNATLTKACSPYHLPRPTVVTGELTIEPGVEIIACGGGCRSRLTIAGAGRLFVQGEADDPVVFTSETQQLRGQWTGILFLNAAPGSRIEHAVIEYAGGPYSALQNDDEFNLYEFPVEGSLLNDSTRDVSVVDVVIQHSRGYAIANTTEDGFELSGKNSYQQMERITLLDNARGVWLPVDQTGTIGSDLCFEERDGDGLCPGTAAPADNFIEVHLDDRLGRAPENFTRDATWPKHPVAYLVDHVNIMNSSTLTLADGVELKMTGSGGITVGLNDTGTLIAVGSAPGSIKIGSAHDAPTPQQYWDGISIWTDATTDTRLEYVDVGYGGGRTWDLNQAPANIQIFNSNPTVMNVHVHHSVGAGIHWNCAANPPGLEPNSTNTADTADIACFDAIGAGIAENFGCPCPGTGCQDRCQP